MKVELRDQVIAITGGARGLGRAMAEALLARGARVAIGDIDGSQAEVTAQELGSGTVAFEVDVTSSFSTEKFVADTEQKLGPLDIMINNAGIMIVGAFLEESDQASSAQVDVNLRGVINGCKAAGRSMVARQGGHILNVASAAGKVGTANLATYSATKHAVVGLTDSLRAEFRPHGVQVSTVMPNVANTRLGQGTGKGLIPMVEPEEVAEVVVWVLEHRANEAFVPRYAELGRAATACLPSRARDFLFRIAGGHAVTLDTDSASRAEYEASAVGPADGTAPSAE